MKNIGNVRQQESALKFTLVLILFLLLTVNGSAQRKNLKSLAAAEVVKQIEAGQPVRYENVSITNDFDLSYLSQRTNDAVYQEKGKTARVFSAKIAQPMSFKNVVFNGKVKFFRKEEDAKEINEYGVVFARAVTFENCTFNQAVDFELTNFDGGVSFVNSIFKGKPSFVRLGLKTTPNLTKTVFANGSIFKNTQDDSPRNLTVAELESYYRKYLESSK